MSIAELLGLLPYVRKTTRGWMAQCPSHMDKTPSLSIREGDGQRLLLYCFGGCSTQEICTALRLSLADLFPANEKPTHRVRHECRQRQAARVARAQQQQARGLAVDVLREAERLVHSARGLDDSHKWSDVKRERILNQIADAYEVMDREGALHESVET